MSKINESPATFRLPEREIPIPTSVSREAQAMLALGPLDLPFDAWPELDDIEAWRGLVSERDEMVQKMMATATTLGPKGRSAGFKVEDINIDGVPVYVVTPDGVPPNDRRIYLDIHGGAWILGGGEVCRAMATSSAQLIGAPVWSVDYRMPPDSPYPASLDDCLAVYRALLNQRHPGEIIVGGSSSGGNLAAALMLRIRDEGLPFPAAVVLNTPATDLTESGDTWQTNLGLDTVLTGSSKPTMLLYAGGQDLRNPYISPLFGDFSTGYPPTILTSGTRDMLLSDTVRMHRALRAAGIPAELHVWEAAGHGMFLGSAPEDADRAREIRRFIEEHWALASKGWDSQ